MQKIRWGILSTAKIGINKSIPAMQSSTLMEVKAIASRSIDKARSVANSLTIERAYGSYEQLLDDAEIDAIYIPAPNHLHVPWAVKAINAGKHVLCEKPIALSAIDLQPLIAASAGRPHLKVMEGFMYRFHPQWQRAKHLIQSGAIGDVSNIQGFFSFFNIEPDNIRNQVETGGGCLLDVACYCVSQSRFILNQEPVRVHAIVKYDKKFGTDYEVSAMLDFGRVTSSFTCSTQLTPHQNFKIFGTKGLIEIEIPVSVPLWETTRIWLDVDRKKEEIIIESSNQYTLQAEAFSKAILDRTPVPYSVDDSLKTITILDAIRESGKKQAWINL
jgi:predicted dehydrogenase